MGCPAFPMPTARCFRICSHALLCVYIQALKRFEDEMVEKGVCDEMGGYELYVGPPVPVEAPPEMVAEVEQLCTGEEQLPLPSGKFQGACRYYIACKEGGGAQILYCGASGFYDPVGGMCLVAPE